MFTSADANDPRLVKLKWALKGTGYRTKRVGRTPIPGEKWRSGYLPLYAAQKFDVYIYRTEAGREKYFNAVGVDWYTERAQYDGLCGVLKSMLA